MNKRRLLTAIVIVILSLYVGLSWGAEPIAVRVIQLNKSPTVEKIPVLSGVAVDPAGKLLATIGDDHVLRIWKLDDGTVAYKFAAHADWIKAVTFRPDGKAIATAGDDRRIRIWDITAAGQPVEYPEQAQAIHALVYSPDGRLLASAGFDDKVRLYTSDGRVPTELDGPGGDICALAFSPDAAQLAAAGRAGTIRLWRVAGATKIRDIQASSRRICALAYAPSGRRLAAAGDDRAIRAFDPSSGSIISTLPDRPGKIRSLCFCAENLLAAGATDNLIRLWNLSTNKEQHQLAGHTGTVAAMAYNPLAGTLISGSFDTTARVWQITDQIPNISQK